MSYRQYGDDSYSDSLSSKYSAGQRVAAPSYLDRRPAQRRSPDRDYAGHARNTSGSSRVGPRQVEEILRYVDRQWSFMSTNTCIPVKIALQLMDQSSLGLADQYDQFQSIHEQLQEALKSIVNEHHQGFNSSIGTFHQIQASIQASQQRVRDLRLSLLDAKANLSTARPELNAFATTSQEYDHMLSTIAHIEQLQAMPEKIEALITEKKFLGAIEALHDALDLMRKPALADIGALADLRVYLGNSEHSLADILLEELHNHLYLKSPYCHDRWKQYLRRNDAAASPASATPLNTDRHQLSHFLQSVDLSAPMLEDVFHNPEVNTFAYLRLLLEALDRMSRLDAAVDSIEQRLPVELFRVVDKCYLEVESRHSTVSRSHNKHGPHDADAWANHYRRADIIEDTLSTLYARLEAIAESHRVLHEVIMAIHRRQGIRQVKALRSFHELWKIYQSEIRALLHDHLSTDGDLNGRSRRENDINANMFKVHNRDKTKRLFKLSATDTKVSSLATERVDLEYIFKASVPGLVSSNTIATTVVTETDRAADRSATGHKILVEPSVFNMAVLLPFSLDFLTRLKDLVPPSSDVVVSTLTTFLDDFLINVFLPQMDETLVDQCSLILSASDAFQEDSSWQIHAAKPVSKGTIKYYDILERFCKMLDSLPAEQAFTMLIITHIRQFYRKCRELYDTLMTRPELEAGSGRNFRRSAQLAESADIRQFLNAAFVDGQHRTLPPKQELELLMAGSKTRPLIKTDLLSDPKVVGQLSTLYTSVRWFTAKIAALRQSEVDKPGDKSTSSLVVRARERWALGTSALSDSPAFLPLDQNTALEFDGLITFLGDLASLILRTLYLELRMQALYNISSALGTTYQLSQPYNDPEPAILELNQKTLSFDADISARLPKHAYKMCIASLASLVDEALLTYATEIPKMDSFGNARMRLNVSVLQQNLRELDDEASLGQSTSLWALWDQGPERVVEAAKAGLEQDVARTVLRLMFGVGNEQLVKGKGPLDHYLGQL